MAWQQICPFQVFYVKPYEAACCQVLPTLQVCTKSVRSKTSPLIPCAVTAVCMTIFSPPFHLKQNATDSSSNSSQKREQPVRTLASPASCEHRRICTRGHLHDHYSSDHYHLEQVRFLPVLPPKGLCLPQLRLVFGFPPHSPKRYHPTSFLTLSFSVSFKLLPVIKNK